MGSMESEGGKCGCPPGLWSPQSRSFAAKRIAQVWPPGASQLGIPPAPTWEGVPARSSPLPSPPHPLPQL